MLSAEQIAARKGKMTGSRVGIVVNGTDEQRHQLWLELTGQAEPEDLSGVWPVLLGTCTEAAQRRWYDIQVQGSSFLTRIGETVPHPKVKWACATLDGWDSMLQCPIEFKHCGGYELIETIVRRYYPQCTWQMIMTGAEQCGLSVVLGADAPRIEWIKWDGDYANELFTLVHHFMRYVTERTPPNGYAGPIEPPAFDGLKDYDMSASNEWGNHAGIWKDNRNGFELCRDAEKALKALVPEDARRCSGQGVQITRARNRNLSLRMEQTK
jgi:hypothetical protein